MQRRIGQDNCEAGEFVLNAEDSEVGLRAVARSRNLQV